MDKPRIRFSEYVQPQIRMESHGLELTNLTPGEDRLAYFRGLAEVINCHLRNGHLEVALTIKKQSMCGQYIDIESIDGSFVARPREDVAHLFDFKLENLGVLLVDGRARAPSEMRYIESGELTPKLSMLFQSLTAGATMEQVLARADELAIDFDRAWVDRWLGDGILEYVAEPSPRAASAADPTLAVTWLGHAMVMLRAGGKTVLVDPLVRPRVRFNRGERSKCFSVHHAEARLFQDYGPTSKQYTLHDLPVPDAVFITHQDIDHFDLSTLLAFPPSTTIYVPDADPSRPWDIDLASIVATVIGDSHRVIKLGHGQSVEVGPMRVTAVPFTGEFPESLPHSWNCYVVESGDAIAVLTADSGIAPAELQLIEERVAKHRQSMLLSYGIFPEEEQLMPYSEEWVNPVGNRLWQWYTRTKDFFAPRQNPSFGVSPHQLKRLVERAGLSYFMPYSRGSTPLHRLGNPYFSPGVQSMSLANFADQERAAVAAGARVPAMRYGVPFPLGSAAPGAV